MTSDAIEIKIGQGTKPGMGGHLPGAEVTEEIARVRDKPVGQDVISPSRFEEIETKEDLRTLVSRLRDMSRRAPHRHKAGRRTHREGSGICHFAEPDFITIDGRGGATGASPKLIRDATSVPTVYALYRARNYLDKKHARILPS